jgi:hypothetical protein
MRGDAVERRLGPGGGQHAVPAGGEAEGADPRGIDMGRRPASRAHVVHHAREVARALGDPARRRRGLVPVGVAGMADRGLDGRHVGGGGDLHELEAGGERRSGRKGEECGETKGHGLSFPGWR